VIIYYPGKDWCNSSGSATRRKVRKWYNEMEKGINKIKESTIICIYKDTVGLYCKNDGFK
jgi:tRNA(Ile)-lysidine synthase TilS/MesJ